MTTTATTTIAAPPPTTPRRGRWIDHWDPEDDHYWNHTGKSIARRNLIFSIFAENVAFSVWLLWSISAPLLAAHYGFGFSAAQMFFLVAVPNLVGAILRIPYTFAVPKFGGRNWTVVSALLLLIPTLLLVVAVRNPATPYWAFLLIAATAGVGGGNFASSMTNITYFYPDRHKGLALGLNAAGGNIGVSVIQLALPVIVGAGGLFGLVATGTVDLARAGVAWALLAVVSAGCAWFFMNNLSVSLARFTTQIRVVRHKHTWIMSMLYVGTFGSFIGYAAAFPLLINLLFPEVAVANFAFLGALIGSLARPFGGWLADRLGGARVTFWNFAAMAAGTVAVLVAVRAATWPLFLASFLVVFLTTGIGNGSTYRMIPMIFQQKALRETDGGTSAERDAALARGRTEAAAVIGLSSAVGAFGGFLIVATFGVLGLRGGGVVSPEAIATAFTLFLGFYVICGLLTWWQYLRRTLLITRAPSLSSVDI